MPASRGYGEVCPLGPAYLPAYAAGARAGIAELAPHLIGLDPTQLGVLNRRMDQRMRGHPYVKSALDMACWDILGKAARPARGGAAWAADTATTFPCTERFPRNARTPWRRWSRLYRAQGYTKFQLKVGGNPDTDIERIRPVAAELQTGDVLIADANTGWTQHQALRVADAVRQVDVYIEQPCRHYEECLAVRQHTDRPFVLDEVIDGAAWCCAAIATRPWT